MFKSQSKNALAQDDTLMKELKLCLEAVGRKVRAFQNKKITRQKTEQRSSVLEKHVQPFVEAIYAVASADGKWAGQITRELLSDKLFEAIGEKRPRVVEEAQPFEAVDTISEKIRAEQSKMAKPKQEPATEPVEITDIGGGAKPAPAPRPAVAPQAPPPAVETPSVAPRAATPVPSGQIARPSKKAAARVAPAEAAGPAPAKRAARAQAGARKTSAAPGKRAKRAAPPPAAQRPAPKAAPAVTIQRPASGPVAKPATIDEKTILNNLTSTPVSIRDLITKLGITDMLDARYLQMKLQALEKAQRLNVEVRQGKKYYAAK
jgi:hypothetical protein